MRQKNIGVLLLPMGKWNSAPLYADVWKGAELKSGPGPWTPGTMPFDHFVLDKNHNGLNRSCSRKTTKITGTQVRLKGITYGYIIN